MNAYERLFARMDGQPIDRIPNLNIVMLFAARQIGVPYGQYVTDYKLLCQGVLECYEKFKLDCLCVISDPMREAEGFGAKVVIPEDDVPFCPEPLLDGVKQIEKLKAIDPASGRRMHDRLLAVQHLKQQAAKRVPVIGWVEGAVAEACDLMDISEAMMNFYDYPDEMEQLLEVCGEQARRFALAQIEAGADIIGIGDAAASLIGPQLYRDFALPHQQKLISAIHQAGARTKLHICGNIAPVLELVAQTGTDILDCDHMVPLEDCARFLPSNMCVCGNYDPVGVLLNSSESDVKREVEFCARTGIKNYISSAGCEVPKMTPPQNLMAVAQTLEQMTR